MKQKTKQMIRQRDRKVLFLCLFCKSELDQRDVDEGYAVCWQCRCRYSRKPLVINSRAEPDNMWLRDYETRDL